MTDYTLHYAPDNASLVVRLALEERGLPYKTHLLDRRIKAHKADAYLKLNPAGRIPALETPQGPMFETAAILLWLADTHGQLGPAPDHAARGDFLKWLFFTSNTLHTALRMTFYPDTYVGSDPESQFRLRSTVRAEMAHHFGLVDAAAAGAPDWFCARSPSVLTFYVAACVRWAGLYPKGQTDWFDLTRYPNLQAMVSDLETRPSVVRCGKSEGWTSRPFSMPQPVTPPEGSAL